MKRMISLCLLVLAPAVAMAQLPENFSYGKYLTGVEDQLRQGPCESFAAVGGVEALYNLFYSGAAADRINLSEREVYVCGGTPTKGVDTALNYIRDQGVIPRGCYPMPPGQCLDAADQGPTQIVNETGRNCPASQISCGSRFKADNLRLTTQMTSNDGIKQALLEYGPLVIGIDDGGAIHTAYHGYLLYGWETQNGTIFWLLRDSWPCSAKNIRNNINLAAIFSDPARPHPAYAVASVSKQKWNGSAWQPELRTQLPFELEQGWQSATIARPANACMNQGQYSIASSLPAGSFIKGWSVRASYYYYNDVQISSTGVLSGSGADVTVVATLQRANGLLENITLPVGDVGAPHTVETVSYCPNNDHREIDLRLTTRSLPGYSYSQVINVPPSSDGSYYTIGSGSWFVHLVSSRPQAVTYSTTVTATQNGNPSCSKTITVPNRYVVAMPCYYGY
ncbi:MAG TPA: C1 family peptidase [Gammaproteobacteria bacterium]|nr:C1 family peptidase [Gammaproteobacteria bacterium]